MSVCQVPKLKSMSWEPSRKADAAAGWAAAGDAQRKAAAYARKDAGMRIRELRGMGLLDLGHAGDEGRLPAAPAVVRPFDAVGVGGGREVRPDAALQHRPAVDPGLPVEFEIAVAVTADAWRVVEMAVAAVDVILAPLMGGGVVEE